MLYDELIKELPKVGQGKFSKVYRKDEKKVLIKSRDQVKECMSLGWFPETFIFPKIEMLGWSEVEPNYCFYEAKFYPKCEKLSASLDAFDFEFYKELRKLRLKDYRRNYLYENWINTFQTLPGKFHKRRDDLIEAVEALTNYGPDVCFEISPRNIAVDKGKLILLDCFFLQSKL